MCGVVGRFGAVAVLPVAFLVIAASPALAQTAENVALIINDNSTASQRIGEHYARTRALPASNIIRIRTSTQETIDRAAFVTTIESPIGAAISREGLQDRILYIVLTKDVPIRISGSTGLRGTVASVDSELTLLYRRLTGQVTIAEGRVDNPYFLGSRPLRDARPFSHREHDIYLVARLDAFTVEEALALIDRGSSPTREGRIVLDQQDKLVNRAGEDWLEEAATRLQAQGHGERVLLETTVVGARGVKPVLGYYSWGSNDPRNRLRTFDMGFVPGAIAGMFVSSDARTFREPPREWVPTGDSDQTKWFAGTPQSLIGDLIREGVTGVVGHVAEPFLQSTVRPEILFPAYLAGLNLVEAFYLAMPHLSWQNVVVGDPLCAPFRERTLTRSDLEDTVDVSTGLPKLFAERRVAQLKIFLPDVAVRLTARAEALASRGDRAGARTTLEEVTQLAPMAAHVHMQLALFYEQEQNYPASMDRYRRVIELQPRNAIALNNLAYLLAVRRNAPVEARPLAERAAAEAPQSAVIVDTLAWIEYLLGDHTSASKLITTAVRGAPNNPEVRLHAAFIYAATGSRGLAETELQESVKLNPALNNSEDVKRLRVQLEKLAAGER